MLQACHFYCDALITLATDDPMEGKQPVSDQTGDLIHKASVKFTHPETLRNFPGKQIIVFTKRPEIMHP